MEPTKRPRGRPRKVEQKAEPMQTLPANTVVKAKYEAAGTGRRMRAWNPPSTGPNKSVQGIQTIRNRTRDARRNDWSGESGPQKWTTNLIGIGIVPRFKRIKS
ncbi:MAG: phage portal protein, partial [Microbacteriaceae bacterium]